MHFPKKGLRVLGIAESYSGRSQSTLAGIVMRRDLIIDGAVFSRVTVGGMDANEAVLSMVLSLDRRDIGAVMLSGCVIAFFNIIDPEEVCAKTGLPVICVTYENSDGLEGDIRHHFPGDEKRLAAYRRLGDRTPYSLNGGTVYLRSWGITAEDAGRLVSLFTLEGKVPEPVRVARICARAAHARFT
jgi:Uncharacterized conserved protein